MMASYFVVVITIVDSTLAQYSEGVKKIFSTFFKFLRKKVSRLDKKASAQFFSILGVVICKNHVARPLHSFNKCRKFLLSCQETFFCRNLKNVGM